MSYDILLYIAFFTTMISLTTTVASLFLLNPKRYHFESSHDNGIVDIDDFLNSYAKKIKYNTDIGDYKVVISETENKILHKYIKNRISIK